MPSPAFQPATASGAALSRCRRYRYALWRTWEPELPRVVFIALNPSTADACVDDPTLRRCMGFARAWGYGGVITGNLFAWRATDPRELLRATDPVGPRNDRWLRRVTNGAPLVIAAWGNHGDLAWPCRCGTAPTGSASLPRRHRPRSAGASTLPAGNTDSGALSL